MNGKMNDIRDFVLYALNRWFYFLTPFSLDRKGKNNLWRCFSKYSYLLAVVAVLVPVTIVGDEDALTTLFQIMGILSLFTFGGILIRGILDYKKAKEQIRTFPSMFREGQEDLVDRIEAFFAQVAPHSLDTNQGKSISNLIYVRKRSALKKEVASETFFIDLMMKTYGGKFKRPYSSLSILNARRSYVYEEVIGKTMGVL